MCQGSAGDGSPNGAGRRRSTCQGTRSGDAEQVTWVAAPSVWRVSAGPVLSSEEGGQALLWVRCSLLRDRRGPKPDAGASQGQWEGVFAYSRGENWTCVCIHAADVY